MSYRDGQNYWISRATGFIVDAKTNKKIIEIKYLEFLIGHDFKSITHAENEEQVIEAVNDLHQKLKSDIKSRYNCSIEDFKKMVKKNGLM